MNNDESILVPTGRASELTGTSQRTLTWQCKHRVLEAQRVGTRWMLTQHGLRTALAMARGRSVAR